MRSAAMVGGDWLLDLGDVQEKYQTRRGADGQGVACRGVRRGLEEYQREITC